MKLMTFSARIKSGMVQLVGSRAFRLALITLSLSALCILIQHGASAADLPVPSVQLGMGSSHNPKQVAVTLQILILMTVLTLAPSIIIMTTAFTRIVIVFSILRSALGTPQIPPNQVLIGLALFLTLFIMQPTIRAIDTNAYEPYMHKQIGFATALDRAETPLRSFMIRQTYKSDLTFFISISHSPMPKTADNVSMVTLVPDPH